MELVAAIICLCLLFPAGAAYGYIRTRRQKAGGKKLLEAAGSGGRITIDRAFTVTAAKKWCRVGCLFTWERPPEKADERLHRYSLGICTGGRELYREERSMTEFFGSCWHRGVAQTGPGAAGSTCDAVLLEFLPPGSGEYTVAFDLQADEDASRLAGLTLTIHEGVWPRRRKPAVHACIDLHRKSTAQGEPP